MLGAEPSSVIRWFDKGVLRGWRTPGGHRRVRASSVVSYLRSKGLEVPPELEGVPAGGLGLVRDEPKGQIEDDRSCKVLWIDDDASLLLAAGREIQAFDDVSAILADDPVDALLDLTSYRPHLILLGLEAAEVSALDACRTLKARPECRDVPIILVGREVDAEKVEEGLAAGAEAVVSKPLLVRTVVERVREAAKASRQRFH